MGVDRHPGQACAHKEDGPDRPWDRPDPLVEHPNAPADGHHDDQGRPRPDRDSQAGLADTVDPGCSARHPKYTRGYAPGREAEVLPHRDDEPAGEEADGDLERLHDERVHGYLRDRLDGDPEGSPRKGGRHGSEPPARFGALPHEHHPVLAFAGRREPNI